MKKYTNDDEPKYKIHGYKDFYAVSKDEECYYPIFGSCIAFKSGNFYYHDIHWIPVKFLRCLETLVEFPTSKEVIDFLSDKASDGGIEFFERWQEQKYNGRV